MADELQDRALVERWLCDQMPADAASDDEFVRRVTWALARERIGVVKSPPYPITSPAPPWREWESSDATVTFAAQAIPTTQEPAAALAPATPQQVVAVSHIVGPPLQDCAADERPTRTGQAELPWPSVGGDRKPGEWLWVSTNMRSTTVVPDSSEVAGGVGDAVSLDFGFLVEADRHFGRCHLCEGYWQEIPRGDVASVPVMHIATQRTVAQALGLVVVSYFAVDYRALDPRLLFDVVSCTANTSLLAPPRDADLLAAVHAVTIGKEERHWRWRGRATALLRALTGRTRHTVHPPGPVLPVLRSARPQGDAKPALVVSSKLEVTARYGSERARRDG